MFDLGGIPYGATVVEPGVRTRCGIGGKLFSGEYVVGVCVYEPPKLDWLVCTRWSGGWPPTLEEFTTGSGGRGGAGDDRPISAPDLSSGARLDVVEVPVPVLLSIGI